MREHGNFWSVSTIKEDFHNMFQGAPTYPGIVCDPARLLTGWVRDVLLPSAPSPLFTDVHEMDRFELKIMQKYPQCIKFMDKISIFGEWARINLFKQINLFRSVTFQEVPQRSVLYQFDLSPLKIFCMT